MPDLDTTMPDMLGVMMMTVIAWPMATAALVVVALLISTRPAKGHRGAGRGRGGGFSE